MGSINLVRFPHPSSCADRLLGVTSDYLCFNGKMAEVVGSIDLATKRYSVQLIDKTASMSMIITACKIISYVTIVIPLIVFAVHCMLRSMYDFSLVSTDAPKGNVDPVEVESESDAESLNGVRKASDQDRDAEVSPSDSGSVEDDSASARVVLSSNAPKGNVDPVETETVEDDEVLSEENRVRKLVREGRTAELVRKGEFFSIINDELKKMGSSFSVLDFVGYSLNGR
ncbi:MAG: hypothetical protein HY860_04350 [Chlamydiales bacterium]|nr:hypothetical protein [Chlamydiales bacterium]